MKSKHTLATAALLILTAGFAAAGPSNSRTDTRNHAAPAPVRTAPAPVRYTAAPARHDAHNSRSSSRTSSHSWSQRVEVKVQSRLKQLGYYSGRVDGDFGRGSRYALIRFQRHSGLQMTGTLDSRTLRALRIY